MNDMQDINMRAIDPELPPRDPIEGIFRTRAFRYGIIKYLAADYGVGAMLEKYGEYSEGEVVLWRRILRPGDVVVSAGGNIGVHLIPLCQIVGDKGTVITFEPQQFVRENLLIPNLEMNGCDVEVWPTALGAEQGIAHFPEINYNAPNNFGGMELHVTGKVEVGVQKLDTLFLQRLDMLMLDVEGYELQALQGARETIMRCRPYVYIEIDRDSSRDEVLRYLKDQLKYELLFHTPLAFNPDNYDKNTNNPYGAMVSIMCLGVPV